MKKLSKYLPFLGVILILTSVVLLLVPALRQKQTNRILTQLEQRIPQRTTGYEGIYADPAMPALELDGTDYVGVLDLPGYGIQLPVAGVWDTGKLGAHPCLFWGSAYDGTLVIGGNADKGQLDCCGKVNLGDRIRFTDMTGAQFDYAVAWVDRSDDAEASWLMKEENDLTIFTRDPYSLQYIAVRCDLLLD
jgi:sortase A